MLPLQRADKKRIIEKIRFIVLYESIREMRISMPVRRAMRDELPAGFLRATRTS